MARLILNESVGAAVLMNRGFTLSHQDKDNHAKIYINRNHPDHEFHIRDTGEFYHKVNGLHKHQGNVKDLSKYIRPFKFE